MAIFFPFLMEPGMADSDKSRPIPSGYVEKWPEASSNHDGAVFTKVDVQNKNYAPGPVTEADPTVTQILPTDTGPSVSELTAYSPPSEAQVDISTSVDNAATSYSPSESPSPSPSPSTPTTTSTSTSSSISTSSSKTSSLLTTITTTSTKTGIPAAETTSSSDPAIISSGTSTKTKLAIALPISILGLVLICAVLFFLARRRRRRIKKRNALPPPYDIATWHTSAMAQNLTVAAKSSTPEPRGSLSVPAAVPRIPIINVSPSTDEGRTPSPGPSPRSGSAQHMIRGPGDSEAELGVAIAVPMDRRQSATEQEVRGRGGSVASSRVPSRLARMPFEDFEDDEVGIGVAVSGDDDAVSDVSESEVRRGKGREYDEVSVVSSFDGVSPITEQERRQFR